MTTGCSFPYPLPRPYTAEELAAMISTSIEGRLGDFDSVAVNSVAALDDAVSGSVCFAKGNQARVSRAIEGSAASFMIVENHLPEAVEHMAILRVADAATAFAEVLSTIFPDETASTDRNTHIDPSAQISDDVSLGQGCFVGPDVRIGSRVRIGHNVVLHRGTRLGDRVTIQDGTVIGGEGHGYGRLADGRLFRWPHLGCVFIGDDAEVGMNSVVVRGMLKDTTIGRGSKVGQLVSIGHNCSVGEDCFVATRASLCGSVTLQDRARVGVGAVVNNRVTVGQDASVGLGAVVTKAVAAETSVFGNPAQPIRTMRPI